MFGFNLTTQLRLVTQHQKNPWNTPTGGPMKHPTGALHRMAARHTTTGTAGLFRSGNT